jgi:hypothetical protein
MSSSILDLGTRWRWSASRPNRFTPGEITPGTHWIGGCVGHRAGLDAVERKILACRESNTGHPARGPSLYRLLFWNRIMDIYVGMHVYLATMSLSTPNSVSVFLFMADLSESYKQLRPEADVSLLITIHPNFPDAEYLNRLLSTKT